MKVAIRGQLSTDGKDVYVDPYSPNPLAEEAAYRWPELYAHKTTDPPKMFQGGQADLPAFTASGIDPQLLMKLPGGMRHFAAAEPDVEKVHGLFEQYAGDPTAWWSHEGLKHAAQRVEKWMAQQEQAADTRTPQQVEVDNDALYTEIYGQQAA